MRNISEGQVNCTYINDCWTLDEPMLPCPLAILELSCVALGGNLVQSCDLPPVTSSMVSRSEVFQATCKECTMTRKPRDRSGHLTLI